MSVGSTERLTIACATHASALVESAARARSTARTARLSVLSREMPGSVKFRM